jgi:hypothetical protein
MNTLVNISAAGVPFLVGKKKDVSSGEKKLFFD